MEEAIDFGQRLSTLSFPVLVFLWGLAHYFDVWVWGKQYRELKAECATTVAELKAEIKELKRANDRFASISETATAALHEDARRRSSRQR